MLFSKDPRQEISQMLGGYQQTQIVYLLVKLNLAAHLGDGPKSFEDIGVMTGLDASRVHRIMRLGVVSGFLTQGDDGRFALTEMGQCLGEESIRRRAILDGEMHYPAWGALYHTVETGEPAFDSVFGEGWFDYCARHADHNRHFNAGMARATEDVAECVVAAYDFSNAEVVVDVAGGIGPLVAEILRAEKHVTGVLFDLPTAIAHAPEHLAFKEVADRCELVSGDFFDSVPSGGDVYLVKSILHDWDDAQCETILQNVRKAIQPDGRLLVIEGLMPDRVDETTYIVSGDLLMMALTPGKERTEAEFRALFVASGFELLRTIDLNAPRPHCIIEGKPV